VIGAHLFTLGSAGSRDNFDFGRFLPLLIDYITSTVASDDPTWPQPGIGPGRGAEEDRPAPQPEPSGSCAPRSPYSRRYLLLPQNATWACTHANQTIRSFREGQTQSP
jgi:hypothetical protein